MASKGWISVDEKLPEKDGRFLCTVQTEDGPEVHTLYYSFGYGHWIHEGTATFHHSYWFEPTHWKKIPAPASTEN